METSEEDYILLEYYFDKNKLQTTNSGVFLSYTLDANRIYSSKSELTFHENAIIVYNTIDGIQTLKRLVEQINAQGYTVTNAKNILT